MANIKQQKKRIGQDAKRRAANAMFKSSMKTAIKRVETAADNGHHADAVTELSIAFKKLDKALSKGILHKNNVARQKSYLQTLVNDLAAGKEIASKSKPKAKAKPKPKVPSEDVVNDVVADAVEATEADEVETADEEKKESPEA